MEPETPERESKPDRNGLRFYKSHGAQSGNSQLATALERNIRALEESRKQDRASRGFQEKLADAVTAVSGSMVFVYLHVGWFAVWIGWNVGAFGLKPFDPFPFGLLTMIVSLEAIFLSTFVLISQNRMAKFAEDRADLDLQINILGEHEVTRLLRLTDAIAAKLGVEIPDAPEIGELEKDIEPEAILRRIEGGK